MTEPAPYFDAPVIAMQWDGTNPLDFAKWLESSPSMDVDGSLKVRVGPKRGRLVGLGEWLVKRPDDTWDVVSDEAFKARFTPVPADGKAPARPLAAVADSST